MLHARTQISYAYNEQVNLTIPFVFVVIHMYDVIMFHWTDGHKRTPHQNISARFSLLVNFYQTTPSF